VLFQAQLTIGTSTSLKGGDSNLPQIKITASAVSKLDGVSNNLYIKL